VFGLNEALPPVIQPPARKSRSLRVVLVFLALCLLEIPAYLLWKRTQRMEVALSNLSGQSEETRREAALAQTQSGSAMQQATAAKESSAQAAQQRDQAVQAQAQSAQAAAEAQQKAQVATQEATQAQQEAQALRADREAQLDRLHSVLSQIASTRKTSNGLVVTLDSNAIRFDFDKSIIRPGNRELLSRMAGVLMTLQGYGVYVYGYTDDVGTKDYNQKLSERRASAVRDYLVGAGVDPSMIHTKGYGKTDPLESGDSEQARARNRRVEIGIVDSVLRLEGEVNPNSPSQH
jgi:outer membrane protein OmpA-like peptidoglycan-associated protein